MKKRELSNEERKARYIIDRERVVTALRRLEEKHGWMGVMAAIQYWFRKPLRGGFDYYLIPKDEPKKEPR